MMTKQPPAAIPGSGPGTGPPGGRVAPLAVALAVALALFLVVRGRYQPPAARPASALPAEFSAVRAENVLKRVLGNGQPHPVGSLAAAAVRQAILAELLHLGYQPHVEQGFACSDDGVCAQVENVLARLDGREGGKAVLLASHYDSVPAGPGASDDGSGVAAELEIARALKVGPAPRHPVIFLFDEGEEAGLLGAVAFVEQSGWAREVGAAVNLEARGTSGPSLMFETGGHSRWLMPLFARAVRRPLANSLYYAVYRRLPNDTDFSIFVRHGFDGFNFAFIGDVTHYHTPLDDLRHLDPRSLESQGENGLAAVRALANANLGAQSGGEAVFFDVAAWRMVWWPIAWTLRLAGLALLLVLACTWWLLRERLLTPGALGRGIAVWPAAVAIAALLAVALRWLLRAVGAVPSGWVAHPAPLVAAFWLLGIGTAFAAAAWLGRVGARQGVPPRLARRREFWGFWCGTWLWSALLGLAVAFVLPEGSFLWLVPALVAGMCGIAALLFGARGWRANAAAILPAAAAALLTFEIALLLYPALGAPGLPIVAVLLASLATAFAPLLVTVPGKARRGVVFAAAGAAVILAAIAAFLPPYTAQSPERMNFVNVGTNLWLPDASDYTYATPESGKLPPPTSREMTWLPRAERLFPWSRAMGFRAMHADQSVPPIEYAPRLYVRSQTVAGNRIAITGVLQAGGVHVVAVVFPPEVKVDSFQMQGQAVPPLSARAIRAANGWKRYFCVTTPASGVKLTFTVEGPPKFKGAVLSEWEWSPNWSPELPVRPANAARSQSGDVLVLVYEFAMGNKAGRQDVLGGQVPRHGADP